MEKGYIIQEDFLGLPEDNKGVLDFANLMTDTIYDFRADGVSARKSELIEIRETITRILRAVGIPRGGFFERSTLLEEGGNNEHIRDSIDKLIERLGTESDKDIKRRIELTLVDHLIELVGKYPIQHQCAAGSEHNRARGQFNLVEAARVQMGLEAASPRDCLVPGRIYEEAIGATEMIADLDRRYHHQIICGTEGTQESPNLGPVLVFNEDGERTMLVTRNSKFLTGPNLVEVFKKYDGINVETFPILNEREIYNALIESGTKLDIALSAKFIHAFGLGGDFVKNAIKSGNVRRLSGDIGEVASALKGFVPELEGELTAMGDGERGVATPEEIGIIQNFAYERGIQIMITQAAGPAIFIDGVQKFVAEAAPVVLTREQVVSTLGAGDAFRGGMSALEEIVFDEHSVSSVQIPETLRKEMISIAHTHSALVLGSDNPYLNPKEERAAIKALAEEVSGFIVRNAAVFKAIHDKTAVPEISRVDMSPVAVLTRVSDRRDEIVAEQQAVGLEYGELELAHEGEEWETVGTPSPFTVVGSRHSDDLDSHSSIDKASLLQGTCHVDELLVARANGGEKSNGRY